jgi:hypothetical protein
MDILVTYNPAECSARGCTTPVARRSRGSVRCSKCVRLRLFCVPCARSLALRFGVVDSFTDDDDAASDDDDGEFVDGASDLDDEAEADDDDDDEEEAVETDEEEAERCAARAEGFAPVAEDPEEAAANRETKAEMRADKAARARHARERCEDQKVAAAEAQVTLGGKDLVACTYCQVTRATTASLEVDTLDMLHAIMALTNKTPTMMKNIVVELIGKFWTLPEIYGDAPKPSPARLARRQADAETRVAGKAGRKKRRAPATAAASVAAKRARPAKAADAKARARPKARAASAADAAVPGVVKEEPARDA